ncbi:MAG TPA: HAD family hydrolase [Fimbriiglobus sp.]|jgi:phosphoglycolate phosphatase-like HAD superfamily hydrolase
MRILLFDIDGTLVRTGGAGKIAMEAGLRAAFGVADVLDTVPYSGRTDPDIGRELLAVHGIDPNSANLQILTQAYLDRLPDSLVANPGHVLPGVAELLEALRGRSDVHLGLLTGNVRAGAEKKLGHYGLWDVFGPVGGFGDDRHDRDDVARIALESATSHFGRPVNPQDVWVIGDTPLDVRCARAIGANVVAVATGWHSIKELRENRPDETAEDLSDTEWALTVLLGRR